MRRTHAITLALAVLALVAPPAARHCAAQLGTEVVHEGLLHTPLGAADVSISGLTGRLQVANIGSSGQDGVEISWVAGARAMAFSQPDFESELGTPGCVQTIVLRGTVSGAPVTIGTVQVTRNSDGSETLQPDFSGVHAPEWSVELLDAAGGVVYSSCCKHVGWDIKVSKPPLVAGASQADTGKYGKWIEIESVTLGSQSVVITYPEPMLAEDGPSLVACRGVRFSRNAGDEVSSVGPVGIHGQWPVGTGPGSFALALEPVTPPCAGLDCPNGPGTSLRVVGDGQFSLGQPLDPQLTATPKDSTRKIRLRESPTRPSHSTRPPIKRLSLAILNPASSGLSANPLEWRAEGTVNGIENQELCTMECVIAGGQAQYVPDFSAFGYTSYRVTLRSGGAVLAEVVDPVGGFTVVPSGPDEDIQVELVAGGPRIIRNCRTPPCPGEPVIVNGLVYFADQIEVEGIAQTGAHVPAAIAGTLTDLAALEVASFDAITVYGGNAALVNPVAGVDPRAATLDFARPRVSPNPALGSVRVQFALSRDGHARITVADVAGRTVRQLADTEFAAGGHDILWDGRTDAGRQAPVGVFFVRVESGSASRVTRLTKLW
ncbi:MAG: hypothetical protein IT348_16765 [Candidatus Eisenbacteria bacterium]|nr:hypothetical protein [Candidatus Eisenbacteria bacterium]